MFEGLYSYEKVLAVLGIILFVITAGGLVYFMIKKWSLTPLYPLFVLSLVMVGFPAIQKFSYENGKITFEKNLNSVAANPNDQSARAGLQASLKQIEPRAATDPKAGLMVARAFQRLNEPQRALTHVESVLRANPHLTEAVALRSTLSNEVRRTGIPPPR